MSEPIEVYWTAEDFTTLLAQIEVTGYRKAITALRDEATRAVGVAVDNPKARRARAYYSGLEHAADFLESLLLRPEGGMGTLKL